MIEEKERNTNGKKGKKYAGKSKAIPVTGREGP
jgi:hypothetical protein